MCGVCVCVSQRRVSRVCVVVGVGVHASSPIRVWAGSMKNVYFAGAERPFAQSLMSALVDILRAALRECRRALTLTRVKTWTPAAHGFSPSFAPAKKWTPGCEHAQHRRRGRPRPQTGTGTATSSVPSDSARAELGYPTPGSQCSRNRRPLVALKLRSDFFTTLAGLVLQQCRSS